MNIRGKRADGALLLSIGGGLGIIMRGDNATKALDLGMVEKLGPWEAVPNTLEERRAAQKQLDRCRTIPLPNFDCGR